MVDTPVFRKSSTIAPLILAGVMFLCASSILAESTIPAANPSLIVPPTLRRTTVVNAPVVTLGDVFDGLSQEEASRTVANAPAASRQVTWDARVLARLAQAQRIGWAPSSLADQITITRSSTRLDPEALQHTVVDAIERTPFFATVRDSPEATLNVRFDGALLETPWATNVPPFFQLSDVQVDGVSNRFRGTLAVETTDGVITKPIAGRVTVQRALPVLARRIDTGTIVGKDDVVMQAFDVDQIPRDVAETLGDLEGREAKRPLSQGQPIRRTDIRTPRLITHGQMVTMQMTIASMQITARGKALQDGAEGETIRVLNMESHKTIDGVVGRDGVVVVGQ